MARRAPAAPPVAGPGPVSALVPAGRALHEELIWKTLDLTSAPLCASGCVYYLMCILVCPCACVDVCVWEGGWMGGYVGKW